MAKPLIHTKGFLCILMNWEEAQSIGFGILDEGCICMTCNEAEKENIYYIAALNDTMCQECAAEFLQSSKWFSEDSSIEQRNYRYTASQLGILQDEPVKFSAISQEGPL